MYHEEISLEGGILFKGHRLIVPKSERQCILDILHTGHYGINKMTLGARENVFWPGISNDIKTLAETCTVFQENSKSQLKEMQQQTEVPLHAWERLGLLVVDYYSRFPIIQNFSSLNRSTRILHLKQIFSEYGIPKTIVKDERPQFKSDFQDFPRIWHFPRIKSSPHHLQSNGLAERFVQTVKTTLIKTMATHEDPHLALFIYRVTPHSHNLPSPAELVNSSKYHALLPTRALAQREREDRSRECHDAFYAIEEKQPKNNNTKLQGFKLNDPVYIQLNPHRSKWIKGTVIELSYKNTSGC